jgi:hypothetical protein
LESHLTRLSSYLDGVSVGLNQIILSSVHIDGSTAATVSPSSSPSPGAAISSPIGSAPIVKLPNLYDQPLRKCILTAAIGPYAEMHQVVTLPRLDAYADAHGYHLRPRTVSYPGRPPAWIKVEMLRDYLYTYDLLVWIDADVLIVRPDYDVGEVLTRTFGFQALAVEDRQINTGVWIVRGGDPMAAEFLAAVDEQEDLYEHPNWEQAAVKRLLGYTDRSPGELNPDWLRGTVLLPPEINDLTRRRPAAVMHHHAGFGRPEGQRLAELQRDAE